MILKITLNREEDSRQRHNSGLRETVLCCHKQLERYICRSHRAKRFQSFTVNRHPIMVFIRISVDFLCMKS